MEVVDEALEGLDADDAEEIREFKKAAPSVELKEFVRRWGTHGKPPAEPAAKKRKVKAKATSSGSQGAISAGTRTYPASIPTTYTQKDIAACLSRRVLSVD